MITLDSWFFPLPDELRQKGIQTAAMLNLNSELWPFTKVRI
jgi:hypothetical protein